MWASGAVQRERADVDYSLIAMDFMRPSTLGPALRSLSVALGGGLITGLPVSRYALSDVRSAMRAMSGARHVGKIVIATGSRQSERSISIGRGAGILVTGGLGSLGTLVSLWLAVEGAPAPMTLIGRSGRVGGSSVFGDGVEGAWAACCWLPACSTRATCRMDRTPQGATVA